MDKENLVRLLKLARQQGITSPKLAAPDHLAFFARYGEVCQTTTECGVRGRLMELLRESDDLDDFNNKVFVLGNRGNHVDYETLATWLLFRTKQVGEQQTVEELERFTELEATPASEILAFSGVEICENVALHKKIRMGPFESIPGCFAKDALDYSNLKSNTEYLFGPLGEIKSFCPSGALIREIAIKPKTCDPDDFEKFVFHGEELCQICDLLTLVRQSTPVPLAYWVLVDEWVPCSVLVQGGWTGPGQDILRVSTSKFTASDYSHAKRYVRKYFELREHVRKILRISLQRLNQSRRRTNQLDKAIDLGIGLESLLLHDRGSNEPISFPFRLRGAWLLGADARDRLGYLHLLKSIYDCRCEAVHAGKFRPKFAKKLPLPLNELLKKGEDLCADMIKWVLEEGKFPDWEKLILGGNVPNNRSSQDSEGI